MENQDQHEDFIAREASYTEGKKLIGKENVNNPDIISNPFPQFMHKPQGND